MRYRKRWFFNFLLVIALFDKKRFKIVGVELKLGKNKNKINKSPFAKNVKLLEGSSTSDAIIKKVKSMTKNYKKPLVILDSNHTHEHVLKELKLYSKNN